MRTTSARNFHLQRNHQRAPPAHLQETRHPFASRSARHDPPRSSRRRRAARRRRDRTVVARLCPRIQNARPALCQAAAGTDLAPVSWPQTAPYGTRGAVFSPSAPLASGETPDRENRAVSTIRRIGRPGVPQGAVCGQLARGGLLNRDRHGPDRPVGQSPAGRIESPPRLTGETFRSARAGKLGSSVGKHRFASNLVSCV